METESPAPRFEIITTADGSPTARFDDTETMHSLRGAFGETVYIYGSALERAKTKYEAGNAVRDKAPRDSVTTPLRTMSLGIGLAYVEILTAALYAKDGIELHGESFELVDELTESFRAWVFEKPKVLVDPEIYDDIAKRTFEVTGVAPSTIRKNLKLAIEKNHWRLRPALDIQTEFQFKFDCVAFDAFSSKSTPHLWSREFLDRFLKTACADVCVLSTYACTGHLKRALIDAGFTLEIREGYASKRDSTLALR